MGLFNFLVTQAVSLGLGGAVTGICLDKTDLNETESILAGAGAYMLTATALGAVMNDNESDAPDQGYKNLRQEYDDYLLDEEDNDDDDEDDDDDIVEDDLELDFLDDDVEEDDYFNDEECCPPVEEQVISEMGENLMYSLKSEIAKYPQPVSTEDYLKIQTLLLDMCRATDAVLADTKSENLKDALISIKSELKEEVAKVPKAITADLVTSAPAPEKKVKFGSSEGSEDPDLTEVVKDFAKELEKEVDKLLSEKPSLSLQDYENLTKDQEVTSNGIHWSQPKHHEDADGDIKIEQDLGNRYTKKGGKKPAKANNHLHKERRQADKALAG